MIENDCSPFVLSLISYGPVSFSVKNHIPLRMPPLCTIATSSALSSKSGPTRRIGYLQRRKEKEAVKVFLLAPNAEEEAGDEAEDFTER